MREFLPGQDLTPASLNPLVRRVNLPPVMGQASGEGMASSPVAPRNRDKGEDGFWGKIIGPCPPGQDRYGRDLSQPDRYLFREQCRAIDPNTMQVIFADLDTGEQSVEVDGVGWLWAENTNQEAVEYGTVVWITPGPMYVHQDGQHTLTDYRFTAPGTKLVPIELVQDLIPMLVDTTSTSHVDKPIYWIGAKILAGDLTDEASLQFVEEPIHIYPVRSPQERQDTYTGDPDTLQDVVPLSLGVGRAGNRYYDGTRGYARWIAHSYQNHDQQWHGQWEMVTLYAELIVRAKCSQVESSPGAGDSGIADGEEGEFTIWWLPESNEGGPLVTSNYVVIGRNTLGRRVAKDDFVDLEFNRQANEWTTLLKAAAVPVNACVLSTKVLVPVTTPSPAWGTDEVGNTPVTALFFDNDYPTDRGATSAHVTRGTDHTWADGTTAKPALTITAAGLYRISWQLRASNAQTDAASQNPLFTTTDSGSDTYYKFDPVARHSTSMLYGSIRFGAAEGSDDIMQARTALEINIGLLWEGWYQPAGREALFRVTEEDLPLEIPIYLYTSNYGPRAVIGYPQVMVECLQED